MAIATMVIIGQEQYTNMDIQTSGVAPSPYRNQVVFGQTVNIDTKVV